MKHPQYTRLCVQFRFNQRAPGLRNKVQGACYQVRPDRYLIRRQRHRASGSGHGTCGPDEDLAAGLSVLLSGTEQPLKAPWELGSGHPHCPKHNADGVRGEGGPNRPMESRAKEQIPVM